MPTLDSVVRNEKQHPNSTIDARRILATVERLAGVKGTRRFLDVGCGYGFFSKEALNHDLEVIALEVAKNERAIAEQMTGLAPVNTSFEEFDYSAGSLSLILLSQILEHALDVNLWVQKANLLLENGGILTIALPNFGSLSRIVMQEKEPYICPPAHLNFFNPRSLRTLLVRHGFKVEQIQWVSRIPSASFQRRLPKPARSILPLVIRLTSAALKVVDCFRLGVMINVYARKVSTVPALDLNALAPNREAHRAALLHAGDH
jgi:SAM-dependent methyltransferase